jgi:hypothetical protein
MELMPRGMDLKAPVFLTSWVTAVVVGPGEPVEGWTWLLLADMLREEIETRPYLTEQRMGNRQNPNKEDKKKERREAIATVGYETE